MGRRSSDHGPERPAARDDTARPAPGTSRLHHFEDIYSDDHEPWSFSERGVETLRHERLTNLVSSLAPRRLLDLGCSLGQMTARLATLPTDVFAMDVSPTAVHRARERLREMGAVSQPRFVSGDVTQLPFRAQTFDVILASDGLYSWQLEIEDRAIALRQIHHALVPGGHAVLTEHMRTDHFPVYVGEIRASPLRVVRVMYFHDRPCYQFESWLKAIRHWRVARAARRSVSLARVLCTVGRWFGPVASRHICVIATRD